MSRLLEILLGLPRGFLAREGEFSVAFNPVWPWREVVGAAVWNLALLGLFVWLVAYVYRREAVSVRGRRSTAARVLLAGLRLGLAGLVLLLLNRPVVTLTQNRVEPSVVAVLIDDSVSMRVRDVSAASAAGTSTDSAVGGAESTAPRTPSTSGMSAGMSAGGSAGGSRAISRLDAVRSALGTPAAGVLQELARDHEVVVFAFDREARAVGEVRVVSGGEGRVEIPGAISGLTAQGQATAVSSAVAKAVSELSGRRLAGVVVLTDGRDAPSGGNGGGQAGADVVARLREAGARVFAVPVGGERAPRNLAVQSVAVQDAAFKGDLVAVRATLRASGVPAGTRLNVRLIDPKTRQPLGTLSGPAETTATAPGNDEPFEVEITLKPEEVGELEFAVEVSAAGGAAVRASSGPGDRVSGRVPGTSGGGGALSGADGVSAGGSVPGTSGGGGAGGTSSGRPGEGAAGGRVVGGPDGGRAEDIDGEIDDADNTRLARLAVLEAKVNVLYVEGYPRWDYRFLRTQLIRDKTVDVSILLTSADTGFAQDGDIPVRRFPETMEEMLKYDVVLLGDVDPRQFTDAQLQLLTEFVGSKGGGMAMVAGPRFSPARYRGTPIEVVLPVALGPADASVAQGVPPDPAGFRPVVTAAGRSSGVFRFLPDADANEAYLKNDLQPLFWYFRGVSVKPGAGEALAEHPTDLGPDGKRAPLLVSGRYGAGRTLFSAYDDSWRWRYYTGESVFDTYWVQQIRLLARGRKLGQRLFTLATARPTYELGERVTVSLRVLETNLLRQLPERVEAEVVGPDATVLRRESLVRQEDRPDTYVGSFAADRLGPAAVRVPFLAPGAGEAKVPYEVVVPRLELTDPRVDTAALSRLASETGGRLVPLAEAGGLPRMIPSAAKTIPVESSRSLWDAPVAMALFVLLITLEWVARKLLGML